MEEEMLSILVTKRVQLILCFPNLLLFHPCLDMLPHLACLSFYSSFDICFA
ncbi:hypothetical protein SLEP1_g59652 [Rubroshorea leprosula]|uniref:Uncharacterized protein n=1 Tax=Rubroshorea leprosula TaxID=152421 RepID=A0AAV5MSZ6_9ROSI|nr:hypothetical protein SLEP1_g59652 [Rubroshorea leprosula]